jgi:hypothetical protein
VLMWSAVNSNSPLFQANGQPQQFLSINLYTSNSWDEIGGVCVSRIGQRCFAKKKIGQRTKQNSSLLLGNKRMMGSRAVDTKRWLFVCVCF